MKGQRTELPHERGLTEGGRRRPGLAPRWRSAARALGLGVLLGMGASGAAAQWAGILPLSGALPLAGTCSITFDGTPFSRCDCRMAVVAHPDRYELSALKVSCGGRGGEASALSALIGTPGRAVQLQYDYAGGSGMWVSTNGAMLDEVLVREGVLQMSVRLNGPTHFENGSGKACVDGATGARC